MAIIFKKKSMRLLIVLYSLFDEPFKSKITSFEVSDKVDVPIG